MLFTSLYYIAYHIFWWFLLPSYIFFHPFHYVLPYHYFSCSTPAMPASIVFDVSFIFHTPFSYFAILLLPFSRAIYYYCFLIASFSLCSSHISDCHLLLRYAEPRLIDAIFTPRHAIIADYFTPFRWAAISPFHAATLISPAFRFFAIRYFIDLRLRRRFIFHCYIWYLRYFLHITSALFRHIFSQLTLHTLYYFEFSLCFWYYASLLLSAIFLRHLILFDIISPLLLPLILCH